MTDITIKTSLGKLNCRYRHNPGMDAPVAIVVGSNSIDFEAKKKMYADATQTLFDAFVENGFSTLEFNFRQVKSDKKDLDEDTINLLDLTAVLDWLHTKNIESKSFWVCGIDVGAYAALHLVMRRPEVENYILLSPVIKRNDLGFVVPCIASGLLVRGSEDLRFLEEDCINLQEKLSTKTETSIKYLTIYRAERNFLPEIDQLKTEISGYIKNKKSEDYKNMKLIKSSKRRRRKKRITDDDKINNVNPIKNLDIDNI